MVYVRVVGIRLVCLKLGQELQDSVNAEEDPVAAGWICDEWLKFKKGVILYLAPILSQNLLR